MIANKANCLLHWQSERENTVPLFQIFLSLEEFKGSLAVVTAVVIGTIIWIANSQWSTYFVPGPFFSWFGLFDIPLKFHFLSHCNTFPKRLEHSFFLPLPSNSLRAFYFSWSCKSNFLFSINLCSPHKWKRNVSIAPDTDTIYSSITLTL